MSFRRTFAIVLVAVLAALAPCASSAALTPAQETAADREALERAVAEYEAAQAEAVALDEQVRQATDEFDRIVAEQSQVQSYIQTRAVAMYRAGDSSSLSLLFGASDFNDLIARLDILERLAKQDARQVSALKESRTQAQQSAEALLALQAEQARKLDELSQTVAHARQDLAASEAAQREYEARIAAAAAAAAAARRASVPSNNPDQALSGSGEWRTAVASHYGLNFTGRGASGEAIGPYSMIVAHRTLPFGTLVEFEYGGKRCVARVADRGPFVTGREFDLGPGVARVLGFNGVHEVRYRVIQ